MKGDFEMVIYGGKFKFAPAEIRYDVYQDTFGRTFEEFDDQWVESAVCRLGPEACIEVVGDELNKFRAAVKRAAASFVKDAKPDSAAKKSLDVIYTSLDNRLVTDMKRRLNEAYESIPQSASLGEVAEEGRRSFAELIVEIQEFAGHMNDLMREQLEEEGVIAKPKRRSKIDGQSLYDELLFGIDDPVERRKKKLAALNAMPQNKELIAWCWADDEDKKPIKELANAVGVSLRDAEDGALQKMLGPRDLSTEAKALDYREKAQIALKKIDHSNAKAILGEIDDVLAAFDREARSAGGRVFPTREEAEKQRRIVDFESKLGISTEEEALASKQELEDMIAKLGVDGSWKMTRIDKALAKFDLAARTAGGREFGTREEAAKQRELVEVEEKVDLSTEDAAKSAKTNLEALIARLGIDGRWKLARINNALAFFDEQARTAFGIVYETREEAATARGSRTSFYAALEQAVKDSHQEKFYLKGAIPEKKVTGAMTYLTSGNGDGLFALLDTTLFGSAKLGLVATRFGIVWKNDCLKTRRSSYSWRELGALTGDLALKNDTEIWFEDGVAYEDSGSDADHKEVFKVLCKFRRYSAEATFDAGRDDEGATSEENCSDSFDATNSYSMRDGFSALKIDGIFVGEGIPEKKRTNAFMSMHVKEPMTSVEVLIDATVWGSAKDGLLITNRALYFKNMMEDPVRIEFSDLKDVKADGKSIVFGGQRFSPGVFSEETILKMAEIVTANFQ